MYGTSPRITTTIAAGHQARIQARVLSACSLVGTTGARVRWVRHDGDVHESAREAGGLEPLVAALEYEGRWHLVVRTHMEAHTFTTRV